ncbi:hypothetical protein GOB43_31890 [Sinorhizobium meliloti]|nr:hypothetical protein [Sinorhizobium meliloti]MQV31582.1 hypothetical protein [Sinorhizobium meliloti]RVO87660.1 hypothetical protein CN089_31570 [Sinorhizobium meliloti]RVR10331.1 hypothetical protein CN243_11365 [Sinorhizobium meliloti]
MLPWFSAFSAEGGAADGAMADGDGRRALGKVWRLSSNTRWNRYETFRPARFLDRMRYCLRVDDKVEFRLADTATIAGLSKQARACTTYFCLVRIFRIGHGSMKAPSRRTRSRQYRRVKITTSDGGDGGRSRDRTASKDTLDPREPQSTMACGRTAVAGG